MSAIEWQSDSTRQPAALALESFCKARRIGMRRIPLPHKPGSSASPAEAEGASPPLVFVTETALEGLNEWLESDVSREHGGVLVGLPYQDPQTGHYFVDIRAAIPAIHAEGSPVHMQYNAEAWAYISGLLEESFADQAIVGWYHSHPGLGVFLSATDRSTHRAFYPHPWSLALVVDPVIREAGWFAGQEGSPLGREAVVLYGRQEADASAQAGLALPNRRGDLRWFLPIALLGLVILIWLWAGRLEQNKTWQVLPAV